nr:hypothetical protein GCM10020093_069840 [Planobispora longispora]
MTGRLDRWERMLERQMAAAPYVLLVISTVLSLLTGGNPWITLGLTALAAAWMRFMPRGGRRRGLRGRAGGPDRRALHPRGMVRELLRLHRIPPLLAVPEGEVAAGRSGRHGGDQRRGLRRGPPGPTPSSIFTYLFFTAAIVAGVSLFSFVGEVTAERSDERRRMVTRLEEAMRENAGLQAQLLVQAREAGVLDERQRMAAEIHDTLAQGLTGIITQLQAAKQAEDWRRHVDNAVRLARESLAEARRSVHAVGPGQLEAAPLPEALEDVVTRWGAQRGACGFHRHWYGPSHASGGRGDAAADGAGGTGQRGQARRRVPGRADPVVHGGHDHPGRPRRRRRIRSGARPRGRGFGLTAMRKRVSRLAGTLEIESEPGSGTAISASVPAVARA